MIITLIIIGLQGDSWQPDHDLSCDFQYDENINAGYVQLDAKFSSVSLEAGLRLENTRIEGEQSGNAYQRDSSFTNHYTHLFPTLSVQYALRNGNSLSLTYGKRIVRPNYRDLNPFVYIHDEYTYDKGNTLLRPELSDNLELAYIHGDLFRVGLAFNYTKDVIIKSYLDQRELCRLCLTGKSLFPRQRRSPAQYLPITANLILERERQRILDL